MSRSLIRTATLGLAWTLGAVAQTSPTSPFAASFKVNTGLPTIGVMTPGPNGSFYAASHLQNILPNTGYPWFPAGLTFSNNTVSRVSSFGNGVFWTTQLPFSITDLTTDKDGNLWAAGTISRDPGADFVPNCTSNGSGVLNAAAVAKLDPSGNVLIPAACFGYGSASSVVVRVDASGGVLLSGAPLKVTPTPGTVGAGLDPNASTFLVRLKPGLTGVDYATQLPVSTVNAMIPTASGSVMLAGTISESMPPLPATQNGPQPQSGGQILARTQDGGATWQGVPGLPSAPNSVSIAAGDPHSIAATGTGWLAISHDAGNTWLNVPPPAGKTSAAYYAFAFVTLNQTGDVIYLQSSNSLQRYQAGQWTTAQTFSACSSFVAGAGSVLFCDSQVSIDSGTTFKTIPLPAGLDPGYRINVLPADHRVIWFTARVNAVPTFYYSRDLGVTWTNLKLPDDGTPQPSPTTPNSMLLHSSSGVDYRSDDFGQSWQIPPKLPCAPLAPSPRGPNYFTCGDSPSQTVYAEVNSSTSELHYFREYVGSTSVILLAGTTREYYILRNPLSDGFVCELNAGATAFRSCTYIGGWGSDNVTHLAPASAGGYWLAGTTNSRNFPVTPGALQSSLPLWAPQQNPNNPDDPDTFLAKLSADGRSFEAVTYFGGSLTETPIALGESPSGQVILLGNTDSFDFPATSNGNPYPNPNPPSFEFLGNSQIGFVLQCDAKLTTAALATGLPKSPLTAGVVLANGLIGYAGQTENAPSAVTREPFLGTLSGAPVVVLDIPGTLQDYIQANGIVDPFSGRPMALTPGAPGRVYGAGLNASTLTLDGQPVPLLQTASGQIDFLVPWATAPGAHTLVASGPGWTTPDTPAYVYSSYPEIMRDPVTLTPVAFNQDGSPHGSSNPAPPGSVLRMIFSGVGSVANPPPDGSPATSQSPAKLPVQVLVGPYTADVIYAGVAVGYAGLGEVQFRVPANAPPSEYSMWIVMENYQSKRALITVGGAQ
jgi:uncharacterized protein (TIGR03437 family)